MSEHEPKTVLDPRFGFRRLDPEPEPDDLGDFYTSRYYDLLRHGDRSPDLRRLMVGGETAAAEREWLESTLYADIAETLNECAPGKRLLEVGCGMGQFLCWMQSQGYDAHGVEPSAQAVELALESGIDVVHGDLAEWIRTRGNEPFDCFVLINVLEHVPDPLDLLTLIRSLLTPGGIICVRVPNDFSTLQQAAHQGLGGKRWWVAAPDHINYFDFASLHAILRSAAFEPTDAQGDFPMEIFLLMGLDYTSDPECGNRCHQWRISFEKSLPPTLRRAVYRSLAGLGLGRNATVFARAQAVDSQEFRLDMDRFHDTEGGYKYMGLRRSDVQSIRRWRNAQIDVLRQKHPLGVEEQERWFDTVVRPTHAAAEPAFLLVSILDEDRQLVGYGGLTNINWTDRRAEVSFLVDTSRARDIDVYRRDFSTFLDFLKRWSFRDLGLHRLFTETFAFREANIDILEASGFQIEGRLRQHIVDPRSPKGHIDSIIHGMTAEDWKKGVR